MIFAPDTVAVFDDSEPSLAEAIEIVGASAIEVRHVGVLASRLIERERTVAGSADNAVGQRFVIDISGDELPCERCILLGCTVLKCRHGRVIGRMKQQKRSKLAPDNNPPMDKSSNTITHPHLCRMLRTG